MTGLAGSGKDAIAEHLVHAHGWQRVALADPMKRFASEIFDWDRETLWGPSDKRNAPDLRYPREGGGWLTPRHALQQLGTEYGRACYPDVWIDAGLRSAARLLRGGWRYEPWRGDQHDPDARAPAGVVISDIRFANEDSAILAAGGRVLRVIRRGAGLRGAAGEHTSERGIDDRYVDHEILNDGTLDDLHRAVSSLLPTLFTAGGSDERREDLASRPGPEAEPR